MGPELKEAEDFFGQGQGLGMSVKPHEKSSAGGRANRSLAALNRTASTARVLNLVAVEHQHKDTAEYSQAPFFCNPILNASIVLKHRLRQDEAYVFREARQTATKVIIPFSRTDLSLGGRSFFVAQPGWQDMVNDMAGGAGDTARDQEVLRIIDQLPSLDPFLVRETLRRHGFSIAPCFFTLSSADIERMRAFAMRHLSPLIALAIGKTSRDDLVGQQTARLVDALLSTDIDDRLIPLQATLQLSGDAFKEGIFSWKGFLYYKWVQSTLGNDLVGVLRDLSAMKFTGSRDSEQVRYLDMTMQRLGAGIRAEQKAVIAALNVYDDAFRDLTHNTNPRAFREFLLSAPQMFTRLGEMLGNINHLTSFWRYRFAPGEPLKMTYEEGTEFFLDFEQSLSLKVA